MNRWWKLIITLCSSKFRDFVETDSDEPLNGAVLVVGVNQPTVSHALQSAVGLIKEFDLPVAVDGSSIVQLEAVEATEEEVRTSLEIADEDSTGSRYYRGGVIFFSE